MTVPHAASQEGNAAVMGGGAAARALFSSLAIAGSLLPRALLEPLAFATARAAARFVPALADNAQRLLGASSTSQARRAIVHSQLQGFARFVCAMARPGPRESYPEGIARIAGPERLAKALTAGRGVVAVSLHLGVYELAAAAIASQIPPDENGSRVAIIYRRDPSRLWERRRARFRAERGVVGIAQDGSAFFAVEALSVLRRGGAVLVAADQPDPRSGVRVNFFGAPTTLSSLPARLAIAADAPMLPAFLVEEPEGRVLVLEEPFSPSEKDAETLTRELAPILERRLKASAGQWLMMRRFWEPA